MKKAILFLTGFLGTVGTLILCSFELSSHNTKLLNQVTYYYVDGAPYQRMEPGFTSQSNIQENTVIGSALTNTSNWSTGNLADPYTSNDGSSYLNQITFNEESTADGGGDGQLTLQEALDAIWNYYVLTGGQGIINFVNVGSATIQLSPAENSY